MGSERESSTGKSESTLASTQLPGSPGFSRCLPVRLIPRRRHRETAGTASEPKAAHPGFCKNDGQHVARLRLETLRLVGASGGAAVRVLGDAIFPSTRALTNPHGPIAAAWFCSGPDPTARHGGAPAFRVAFHVHGALQPPAFNWPLGASQPEPKSLRPEPQLPGLQVGVSWARRVPASLLPQLGAPSASDQPSCLPALQ